MVTALKRLPKRHEDRGEEAEKIGIRPSTGRWVMRKRDGTFRDPTFKELQAIIPEFNQGGLGIKHRFTMKNLTNSPQLAKDYLRLQGFEIQDYGNENDWMFSVRKLQIDPKTGGLAKGDPLAWKAVDPTGGKDLLYDLMDISADVSSGVITSLLMMLGAKAGGVAGASPGILSANLPLALGGGTVGTVGGAGVGLFAGGFLTEEARQFAGKQMGVPQEVSELRSGLVGAASVVAPPLFKAVGAAGRYGMTQLRSAVGGVGRIGRELTGRIASVTGGPELPASEIMRQRALTMPRTLATPEEAAGGARNALKHRIIKWGFPQNEIVKEELKSKAARSVDINSTLQALRRVDIYDQISDPNAQTAIETKLRSILKLLGEDSPGGFTSRTVKGQVTPGVSRGGGAIIRPPVTQSVSRGGRTIMRPEGPVSPKTGIDVITGKKPIPPVQREVIAGGGGKTSIDVITGKPLAPPIQREIIVGKGGEGVSVGELAGIKPSDLAELEQVLLVGGGGGNKLFWNEFFNRKHKVPVGVAKRINDELQDVLEIAGFYSGRKLVKPVFTETINKAENILREEMGVVLGPRYKQAMVELHERTKLRKFMQNFLGLDPDQVQKRGIGASNISSVFNKNKGYDLEMTRKVDKTFGTHLERLYKSAVVGAQFESTGGKTLPGFLPRFTAQGRFLSPLAAAGSLGGMGLMTGQDPLTTGGLAVAGLLSGSPLVITHATRALLGKGAVGLPKRAGAGILRGVERGAQSTIPAKIIPRTARQAMDPRRIGIIAAGQRGGRRVRNNQIIQELQRQEREEAMGRRTEGSRVPR